MSGRKASAPGSAFPTSDDTVKRRVLALHGRRKIKPVVLTGESAERLRALALRWGTTPEDAARRVLDQAFVGRGALVAARAGMILLGELLADKPKPKLPDTSEKPPGTP